MSWFSPSLANAGAVGLVSMVAWAAYRGDLFWNGARSIPLGTFFRKPGFTLGQMPDLSGKVALVTGANSGLGREVAAQLALAKAKVVMACRDVPSGEAAAASIRERLIAAGIPDGEVRVVKLDLADLSQTASAAKELLDELTSLDILVNNAGVATQFPHTLTKDDVEVTFQVNYLGHFLLTTHLLPLLRRSASASIVHLTSGAHRGAPTQGVMLTRAGLNDPDAMGAYARYGMAKLANLIFSKELQRRFGSNGIVSSSVHPGVVATEMLRIKTFEAMLGSWLGPLAWSIARLRNAVFAYGVEEASLSVLYAATAPFLEDGPRVGGELIVPVATKWPARHPKAGDTTLATDLWTCSEQLLAKIPGVSGKRIAMADCASLNNTASATP